MGLILARGIGKQLLLLIRLRVSRVLSKRAVSQTENKTLKTRSGVRMSLPLTLRGGWQTQRTFLEAVLRSRLRQSLTTSRSEAASRSVLRSLYRRIYKFMASTSNDSLLRLESRLTTSLNS